MRTLETYRGYDIVETDWTATVPVYGEDARMPVLVILGMKERTDDPTLLAVEEAREYIDRELAGREAMREARTARWTAVVRHRGNSLAVTIPSKVARELEIDDGVEVEVAIERR